jgi:tetratricopeptide (TPR) repeat protein
MRLHVCGWTNDPDKDQREGVNLARRAIQVTGDDPGVLAWSAYALAYFGEDIDAAIQLIDRALALNPSFAYGWLWSGWLRLWAGQPQLAISHLKPPRLARCSPGQHHGHRSFSSANGLKKACNVARTLQEQPDWHLHIGC